MVLYLVTLFVSQQRNDIEEVYNENPEIITKMFDMMEKFTERFEFIKNQLWQN